MYVVRNEDDDNDVPQAFLHSLNKVKRQTKPNIVEAEHNEVQDSTKHVARFGGIEHKDSYKVVISTYYNGKEIAEAYHHLICKPLPPSNLTSAQWHFVINEKDINFKICLEWEENNDDECSYLIDIFEEDQSIFENSPVKVMSNSFSYIFGDKDHGEEFAKNLSVRVWTMKNGKEPLTSQVPLVTRIPPLPVVMKNYAKYVKDNVLKDSLRKSSKLLPHSGIGENDAKSMSAYSFRVALLHQVAGELKNLHEDLQVAATFSREKTVMQQSTISDNKTRQNSHSIANNIVNHPENPNLTTITNDGEEMEEQFINDLNVAE